MSRVIRLAQVQQITWGEALQQFLWQKQAEGLRESSWKEYQLIVGIFLRRHPEAWQSNQMKNACFAFMSQPVRPATYNHRLTYLKHFFAWCIHQGYIAENPFEVLNKRKDEGRVVNVDADTLSKLLTLPDQRTFAGLRDYALLLLTLDSGIRPKEAFHLLPEDFNNRALEVYVRSDVAKTKVSRTLPISPITAESLRKVLAARHPGWKADVPIFCTADGTSLNRNTWNDRLEEYSRTLGIKVRPYDLRHCFALQFLRNGGNALALQRVLGHTDLSMTKRYVALAQTDLKDQHAVASPLNTLIVKKKRVRKA